MQNSESLSATFARNLVKAVSAVLIMMGLSLVFKPEAQAVPSYSRQTGLPCSGCHYAPPELNAFGRKFKLDGYTFTTKAHVIDDKKDHNAALPLPEAFPLPSSSILPSPPRKRRSPVRRTVISIFPRTPRSF